MEEARAVRVGRAKLARVCRAPPAEDCEVFGEFARTEEVDQGRLREGLDGQACKALVSKGLAAKCAATIQNLRAKHPVGPVLAVTDLLSLAFPPVVYQEV